MISLRSRIFIIISVVVLFILGVSLFLFLVSKQKPGGATQGNQSKNTQENNQTTQNYSGNSTKPEGNTGAPKLTPEEKEKRAVQNLAKIFIERYGTYSNNNDYNNIKDVQEMVVPSLWSSLSTRIGAPSTGSYVGVTTQAISVDIKKWDATSATVSLHLIRSEDKNGQATTKQQQVEVEMVKDQKNWLVSSFKWL